MLTNCVHCTGVASMLISFLIGMYYCVILAWVLWYFFHAFEDPLPWSECPVREDLQGTNAQHNQTHSRRTTSKYNTVKIPLLI